MKSLRIMSNMDYTPILPIPLIEKIEKIYNVKYIGDFCIKSPPNVWTDFPVAIFYQENPQIELGHSNYMGVYIDNRNKKPIMLVNGESAFSQPIVGVIADDGEVVYSRYRHDFVISTDKSVSIDGGRDYTKLTYAANTPELVSLVIDKDKLVIKQ